MSSSWPKACAARAGRFGAGVPCSLHQEPDGRHWLRPACHPDRREEQNRWRSRLCFGPACGRSWRAESRPDSACNGSGCGTCRRAATTFRPPAPNARAMAAGGRSDVARNERGKRPAHITTATSALACCHAQAFSGPESTQSFSKMYLDSQVPTQRGSISSQRAASQYQQAALNLLNWVEVACPMAKDRHNRTAPSCRVLINFGNFSKSRGRAFCTVFLSVKSVFSTVAIKKWRRGRDSNPR